MNTLNVGPSFSVSCRPSNTISIAKAGIIAPATFFINLTN